MHLDGHLTAACGDAVIHNVRDRGREVVSNSPERLGDRVWTGWNVVEWLVYGRQKVVLSELRTAAFRWKVHSRRSRAWDSITNLLFLARAARDAPAMY